jgi:hypothetical protein
MTWIDCDERCRVCSKRLELLLGPDTYGINKATYRCPNCGPGRPARDENGPAQIRAAVAAVLAQWNEADWQKEIAMTHEDPNCFRCCDTGRADVPADQGEGVPCPDCTPADGDTSMVVLVGGWS